jgi:high affinity sulfate transporter 1
MKIDAKDHVTGIFHGAAMKAKKALLAIPLVAQLRDYQLGWLKFDLAAGLSVAAVSLPSAIAYPAIAGLPVGAGLFATIFAMLGYALLGPSRRLMVGPDTGTCIMLAGVLGTLGVASAGDRMQVTTALTIAVAALCFLAGTLRLGFLANFLSRPILVGFLAGISISLMIGQITRLTALAITAQGPFRQLAESMAKIADIHLPTLAISVATLAFLRIAKRIRPNFPAPLFAILLGVAASAGFGLAAQHVVVLGALPRLAFAFSAPDLRFVDTLDFIGGAIAIMLVSFGSGVVTARSFAMKSHSDVNADHELIGFAAANIFSGLSGGFPVSASDSRSAVNFAIGGKTQLTAIIAAISFAGAIQFVGGALAYLPVASLGAILVSAAIDLIDLAEFRALRRISPAEFIFAIVALLGVLIVGVLQGVFISITATLAHLLWAASRPRLAQLGRIPGSAGLYKLHRYPDARPIPGLTLVTLQSALVFFNADFVKHRLMEIAVSEQAHDAWFVLDAAALNVLDSTGVATLEDVRAFVEAQGMAFGLADLNSQARRVVKRSGLHDRIEATMIFPSAEMAAAACDARQTEAARGASRPPSVPPSVPPAAPLPVLAAAGHRQ